MVHRNQMLDDCTINNKMWYHALMTMAHLESEVHLDLQNQHLEEWVLYQLIQRKVIDQDDNWDKVFRPATRVMRYLASLVDLLWVKINQERERVSTSLSDITVCCLTILWGDCLESFACEEEHWLNIKTSALNDRVNALYNWMLKEPDHQ